jgi:hypothetical protein
LAIERSCTTFSGTWPASKASQADGSISAKQAAS